MSHLISKLQHKTYEKGEFSDEQPRTLEETLKLIDEFPWDIERPLTDVQSTGPSVTIQNEQGEYLKIGLYFNGKFAIYILDAGEHLFEKYYTSLEAVKQVVAEFFAGKVDTWNYEKHFFNIGNTPHFKTNLFEYRVKTWRVIMLSGFLIVYTIMFLLFATKSFTSDITALFVVATLLSSVMLFVLGKVLVVYFKNKQMYLKISRGIDAFYFGMNEKDIKRYSKKDIEKVIVYETRGNRNPNVFAFFEIILKDGSVLKFTNMLISEIDLTNKFVDVPVNYGRKNVLLNM